jgi:hypothetical protein
MRRHLEIADAGVIGQRHRNRWLQAPLAPTGFEDVRDGAGAEGVALQRAVDRRGEFLRAIVVEQGEQSSDVVAQRFAPRGQAIEERGDGRDGEPQTVAGTGGIRLARGRDEARDVGLLLDRLAAARRRGDARRRRTHVPGSIHRIALAEAALARKRYDEARQRTSSLVSLFPGDQAVERLRRSVRAHDAPELRLDSQSRTEYGEAADSPGSGYDVRSALLAPPIAERWRLKAAYEFSQASPIEGVVRRIRYGAGVEADWPDASLDATVWINRGSLDRASARVAGTWEIGDHLQVEGSGARYSPDTPLRATYYGIFADGGAVRVSYAWDSATIASASLRRWWFTDGNDRVEASGFLRARVVERPGLSIELRPELWWGANTRLDAPYFNPHRSTSADLSAAARHLLWRWYERSLGHELRLTAGAVAQEANPTLWTGSATYEQILQLTTDSALYYGLGYARRVYDGLPVEDLRVWINLGHRFP